MPNGEFGKKVRNYDKTQQLTCVLIGANMRTQLVYDLPLRFFHWIFAVLFVTAFLIAKTVDDESTVFSYHMLAGFLLVFIVSLRILWGFIGTKYSRFSNFALSPRDFVSYFTGILSGDKRKWAGHNPASSWAAILMFIFAIGLGMTGYLMANGQKETYEDIHELLANAFLVTVLLHIAGVLLHAIRHNDGIGLSMVDGAKENTSTEDAISNSRPVIAILFIILVSTCALYLINNFNNQNQTLNFFGTQLLLGENEGAAEVEPAELNEKYEQDGDSDND